MPDDDSVTSKPAAPANIRAAFYDFQGPLPSPAARFRPHSTLPDRPWPEITIGNVEIDVWASPAGVAEWGRSLVAAVCDAVAAAAAAEEQLAERASELHELLAELQAENALLKRIVAEQRAEIERLRRPAPAIGKDPTRYEGSRRRG